MKPLILYARVSRDDLHCENQKKVLLEWAVRNGLKEDIDYIYLAEEESTRKSRPVKETAIKLFREGKASGVVVVRIDRFARSLQELVMDVENLINSNGRFVSIMNGFDFDKSHYNASNQLVFNIFASFAQFEREIIRERTLEGLARATAWGKIKGRHPVECGCGIPGHDGENKPIRDSSNKVIGWTKQTPPLKVSGNTPNSENNLNVRLISPKEETLNSESEATS